MEHNRIPGLEYRKAWLRYVVGEVGLPISREMLLRARRQNSVAMVDGVIRVRAIIRLISVKSTQAASMLAGVILPWLVID
jgi:hypothetical protein